MRDNDTCIRSMRDVMNYEEDLKYSTSPFVCMANKIFMTFQASSNFNISTAVGSTRVTPSDRQLV